MLSKKINTFFIFLFAFGLYGPIGCKKSSPTQTSSKQTKVTFADSIEYNDIQDTLITSASSYSVHNFMLACGTNSPSNYSVLLFTPNYGLAEYKLNTKLDTSGITISAYHNEADVQCDSRGTSYIRVNTNIYLKGNSTVFFYSGTQGSGSPLCAFLLNSGDTIRENSNWFNSVSNVSDMACPSLYIDFAAGRMINYRHFIPSKPGDAYVGFKIKHNNRFYFGWILVSINTGDFSSSNPFGVVIKAWAVNHTPDNSIIAGQVK